MYVGAPWRRRLIVLLPKIQPFVANINLVADLCHHLINLCWRLIFDVDAKFLTSHVTNIQNISIRTPKSAIEVAKIESLGTQ